VAVASYSSLELAVGMFWAALSSLPKQCFWAGMSTNPKKNKKSQRKKKKAI
jgi:hypothetical protein